MSKLFLFYVFVACLNKNEKKEHTRQNQSKNVVLVKPRGHSR